MVGSQIYILIVTVLVYLMPAVLLLIAAFLFKKRTRGLSANLIVIGALMLAIASIYAIGNYYIAMTKEAADVAAFTMRWGYIVIFIEFFGTTFVALGLIGISRRFLTDK